MFVTSTCSIWRRNEIRLPCKILNYFIEKTVMLRASVRSDAVFSGLRATGPTRLPPPLYVLFISLKNISPLTSRRYAAVRTSHSACRLGHLPVCGPILRCSLLAPARRAPHCALSQSHPPLAPVSSGAPPVSTSASGAFYASGRSHPSLGHPRARPMPVVLVRHR